MIKLSPLFSGSRGNCTLIQTENVNVLLDVGFGYKNTVARLAQLGITPNDISAVVITHEHSDHVGALKQWVIHSHAKVFAPKDIVLYLCSNYFCSDVVPLDGSAFEIADLTVDMYRCSHDALACFGYRFSKDGYFVASVTDTGIATPALTDFLSPCTTIQLESNHDVEMLRLGSYPLPLKRRILSELGHLSNKQCAEVLKTLIGSNVKNVVLAHLSEQNNTKELALKTATEMYENCGISVENDIYLYAADQRSNGITL